MNAENKFYANNSTKGSTHQQNQGFGRWQWSVLILSAFVLNLLTLSNHGLFEPDEGRYANMALEWTEFGEHSWLEPMLSDVGHYDKPPLIYWLTGSSFLAFGISEFTARLPSLLGGMMTLLGVGLLCYRHYGQRTAFWAIVVCATSVHFWALSHLLTPDMLTCGFCLLGAALTLWGRTSSSKHILIWSLGAICWTLAWWTKATASLVPLGAITLALLVTGNRQLLSSLRPVRLLLIILVLGSPWYLIMMSRHEELKDFFLVGEIVGRVVGHADGRKGFPGYHFAVAAGFWLPWWPVLISLGSKKFSAWKQLEMKQKVSVIPWEVWAMLFVLVIYSCVSSKLITYTISGVPFMAIAVAKLISKTDFRWANGKSRIAIIAAVVLTMIGAGVPIVESRLGSNCTLRQVTDLVKEEGAEFIVLDRYWPGAEFYFGENVIYCTHLDIRQVDSTKGQNRDNHFVDPENLTQRLEQINVPVWFLQYRDAQPEWEKNLVEASSSARKKQLSKGDFKMWEIK